jgi:hypothetical protein
MSQPSDDTLIVERVQTGVRLEKRLLKVLKALADYHDISLGDLLEGIVLHAFEGKAPFEKGRSSASPSSRRSSVSPSTPGTRTG